MERGQIARERERGKRTASDTKISRWNVKLDASSRHVVIQDIVAMTTFKEVFTMLYIYLNPSGDLFTLIL